MSNENNEDDFTDPLNPWEAEDKLRAFADKFGPLFQPRIYIDFTEDVTSCRVDENNRAMPRQTTLGPYIDVQVSDGRVYVQEADSSDGRDIIVAEADGEWFRLLDGFEGRYWMRLHTFPPKPEQAGESKS